MPPWSPYHRPALGLIDIDLDHLVTCLFLFSVIVSRSVERSHGEEGQVVRRGQESVQP